MLSPTRTTSRRRGGRGFTLAESLIASATLAITVAGIVAPIIASYKQTSVAGELTQAASLARELMSEIESKPFADPTDGSVTLGPESGESSRADYDNIDDYNGYQDNTSSLKSLSGDAVLWNGQGVFKRSVSVEYRTTPSGVAVLSGDFAMVSVKVVTPSGQACAIQRLFCRFPRGN